LRGFAHDGLPNEREALSGHAALMSGVSCEGFEYVGLKRRCGDSVFRFNRDALVGDRRGARASVADADNRGATFRFDLLVEGVVPFGVDA
jgi:hypothetical protein